MTGTDMLAKAMANVTCDTFATTGDLLRALGVFPVQSLRDMHRAFDDIGEVAYQYRQIAQAQGVQLVGGHVLNKSLASCRTKSEVENELDTARRVLAKWIEQVDHV